MKARSPCWLRREGDGHDWRGERWWGESVGDWTLPGEGIVVFRDSARHSGIVRGPGQIQVWFPTLDAWGNVDSFGLLLKSQECGVFRSRWRPKPSLAWAGALLLAISDIWSQKCTRTGEALSHLPALAVLRMSEIPIWGRSVAALTEACTHEKLSTANTSMVKQHIELSKGWYGRDGGSRKRMVRIERWRCKKTRVLHGSATAALRQKFPYSYMRKLPVFAIFWQKHTFWKVEIDFYQNHEFLNKK
jgi:hypothetical protein